MQLNIPSPQLKKIHANYPQNFDLCSLKMFEYWLQVSINPTWQGLIEALDKIHYYSLGEKIIRDILKGNMYVAMSIYNYVLITLHNHNYIYVTF